MESIHSSKQNGYGKEGRTHAIACVVSPVIVALVINAVVRLRGWGNPSQTPAGRSCLPPGYVIGAVWTLLLALLGYAWYLTWHTPLAHAFVAILILYCLVYPMATSGLQGGTLMGWLNMGALALACIGTGVTALHVRGANAVAAWYIAPTVAWTLYVNIATRITVCI